jgi:hypothetical protein
MDMIGQLHIVVALRPGKWTSCVGSLSRSGPFGEANSLLLSKNWTTVLRSWSPQQLIFSLAQVLFICIIIKVNGTVKIKALCSWSWWHFGYYKWPPLSSTDSATSSKAWNQTLIVCPKIVRDVKWGEGGGTDWIDLAQDRERLRALVSSVMILQVPQNAGYFLTSWRPGSFSSGLNHARHKSVTLIAFPRRQ